MKYLFGTLLGVFLLISCTSGNGNDQEQQNANGITISGVVSHPQQGQITLERFVNNKPVPFDTFQLDENYSFKKQVQISDPGYYRFNFYGIQFVNALLNKDDITIRVDGNDPRGFAEVVGSRDHDIIQQVQTLQGQFQSSDQVRVVNEKFNEGRQSGDEAIMKEAQNEYMLLDEKFKESLVELIDSAGASLGVIEILRNGRVLDKDKYHDLYVRVAEEAKQELSNSTVAAAFIDDVEKSKKLAIGQVAPEISLPNPDGEIVPLSSLRGKYVLVDFWAKWCGPCRRENPNVVKAYNRFNSKGFEVYGVSLDRRKEDWVKAIEEDGLTWTQVSDLKYFQSEAALTYGINAIPFAILIDPDGVIIAKNLRGGALERKLEEIFEEG